MSEKSYFEKVNDWLNADHESRTIEEGAKLMLQGNRNRILHDNVIRKSNFEKVEYELHKIIDKLQPEVKEMDNLLGREKITVPEMETKAAEMEINIEKVAFAGKRPDHDTLPVEIQAIIEENLQIYREMRSIFERLKILSTDSGHTAEERMPFLVQLFKLEDTLTANWTMYDKYDFKATTVNVNGAGSGNEINAKRVSANRKYLSDNKSKLLQLINSGSKEKAAELLDKMQVRYNELILNGETFASDQITELKNLGLIVQETGETK